MAHVPPTNSASRDHARDAPEASWVTQSLLYPLVILLIFFVVLMIKTAWIGDDAYISFRPLDNLLNGYGLRWNVSERVQVYTDPAWLVLVGLCYAITGEIFITVILLSIAVSFAAVFLLVRNVASSHAAAIAALCALVSSKAFIDYTTSGLENALGYLLAAAFCVCLLRPQLNFEKYRWLVLLGSCAAFNRLDAALLFGPAILYIGWLSWRVEKVPVLRLLGRSILYSVPLWGWILFSLIYFGFAFPNTYYAKIYTGLPKGELFTQGILYYFNSINRDPVTLITLAFALVVVVRSRDARLIAAAVGIGLYLLYIVKIGGDFMSGRFFSVPLIFAVALLISIKLRPAAWLGLAVGFVGLGLVPREPSILADETYGAQTVWDFRKELVANSVADPRGIADERAAYYQHAGLLPVLRHNRLSPTFEQAILGQKAREQGRHMIVADIPGFFGFYAGPEVHLIDPYALGDPLLSKLPVLTPNDWRIGHFKRGIPAGYIESLQAGMNLLEDPKIAELYRSINLLARAPIWGGRRFKEIAKMNLGFYNETIRSLALPSSMAAPPSGTGFSWPMPGTSTRTGRVGAVVTTALPPQTDVNGRMWFVDDVVRISFGVPKEGEPTGAMMLPVHPRNGNVKLDFRVNKQPVSAEVEITPAEHRFGLVRLRGPWKAGRNVVEIIGSDGAAPFGTGARFALREPSWE